MSKREIKFRAWDDNKKEMFICKDLYFHPERGAIGSDEIKWEGVFSPALKTSNNITQFTGLLDKNGKEIYEGDIVKFRKHQAKDSYIRVGEVYFADGDISQFRIKWFEDDFEKEKNYPSTTSLNLREIEVIGNIFENPELLKD